jgi:hypothetical protein
MSNPSSVVTIVCHNCGGPLKVAPNQTLVLCTYCYASSRIEFSKDDTAAVGGTPSAGPGAVSVTSAGTLSDAAADAIRQLLTDGKQDEAVKRYQDEMHSTPEEAALAVQGVFERELFSRILAGQLIRPKNFPMVFAVFVAMVASVALLAMGTLRPAFALPIFALSVLMFPFRRMRTTFRYLGSESGTATVKKLVWLGEMKFGSLTTSCARVWVEVRPNVSPGFQASMEIASRSRSNFFEGEELAIKFLRDNPNSVILARMPANP